jgi:hypothetical protein
MQLASVDAYLLTLPSLVDKRNRRVWQVVRDRAALSGHVQSLLRDLGLERRQKPVKSLDAYLAERATEVNRRLAEVEPTALAGPLRRQYDELRTQLVARGLLPK